MMRAKTTLFMLQSVDGKISTGVGNDFDFDKDLPTIKGVNEGLQQYYDKEMQTDLWSLGSGAIADKIGLNNKPNVGKTSVNFVIIDNSHLTRDGVLHYINRSNKFVLVTSNMKHPAFEFEEKADNLLIYPYEGELRFKVLLNFLYDVFNCTAITIQTGSTLNCELLRQGCIDYVNLIIAPLLVGGKDTPSLIGGKPIISLSDLGVLQLLEVNKLEHSYLQLKYKVIANELDTKSIRYKATSLF